MSRAVLTRFVPGHALAMIGGPEGRSKKVTHDELATSLATHLRGRMGDYRLTWENLGFSDWSKPGESVNCRPDVFSIRATLDVTKCQPWTHEVKVSRSDFLGDLRAEKWRKYTEFSCRVFYAAPVGIIDPLELPAGPGLWEYDPKREHGEYYGYWRLVKQAKHCKGWALPPRHLMKLILGRWGTYAHHLPANDNLKKEIAA